MRLNIPHALHGVELRVPFRAIIIRYSLKDWNLSFFNNELQAEGPTNFSARQHLGLIMQYLKSPRKGSLDI